MVIVKRSCAWNCTVLRILGRLPACMGIFLRKSSWTRGAVRRDGWQPPILDRRCSSIGLRCRSSRYVAWSPLQSNEKCTDGKENTKSSEVSTYEVLEIYGEQVDG